MMSRTSDLVVVRLPGSLPGETAVLFESSVYSASHARVEDDRLLFYVGPTWFGSPQIERRVEVVETSQRTRKGFSNAGIIEARGRSWKVLVEVNKPETTRRRRRPRP
jgi:hypothetical protein